MTNRGNDHPAGRPVLLTGATGFVGRALWPALTTAGYAVRGATRDASRARARWPGRRWVPADLETGEGVAEALAGCGAAYYLVHGMSGRAADFRAREVAAARRFAAAAAAAGVERVVYLGGVAPAGPPSEHLRSRLEVGEALRGGAVPALELRASMVVGAGSASWQIVRDLAARLPAMVLPRWLRSRTQPVAADDAVAALVAGLALPLGRSAAFDLPGPQTLTGRDILEQTARVLGLRRPSVVEAPLLSPWLSSQWVRLVTRADWAVARELVLGLTSDLLARDDRYWSAIGRERRVPFARAAAAAVAAEGGPVVPGGLGRGLECVVARLSRAA
jgi:uncharacterized protein YbjT (DUF2867 family)